MIGIPVRVETATSAGRLYARYKNSIRTLTLEPGVPRACPHGVTINGLLVLDFDEERVLAGVELLAPMSAWRGNQSTAQPAGTTGNIALNERLSGSIHRDWPVIVSKDVDHSMARISFAGAGFNRAVELSRTVSALLYDDHLTGFWFSTAK